MLPWGVTLLGDDLYAHQPFCEKATAAGFRFLFTCKPLSHPNSAPRRKESAFHNPPGISRSDFS